LVAETARFIPRIFRIMETGPVTASRRSQALMSDPDERDADHPGPHAGRQALPSDRARYGHDRTRPVGPLRRSLLTIIHQSEYQF